MCSGAHSWLAPRRSTRVDTHSAPWLAERADSATPPAPQGPKSQTSAKEASVLPSGIFCVSRHFSTAGERLMLPGKTLGVLMVQKWRTLSVEASWALVAMDTETKAPRG